MLMSDKEETVTTREKIRWFKNARLGLFIHWGLYSLLGRGEWVMYRERISKEEYAKLADRFTPRFFDPELWCLAAKQAGMKYLVLTTCHCDGFALFDSQHDDFNSVKTARAAILSPSLWPPAASTDLVWGCTTRWATGVSGS